MSSTRAALAMPRRAAVGFFRGLTYVFKGARTVYFERPGLSRYWAIPVLVTFASLALVFALSATYYESLTSLIWQDAGGEGWVHEVLVAMRGLLSLVVALSLACGGVILAMLIGSVLAAPFNARLGEVLDRELTGYDAPPFSVARALMDVLRALFIEGGFFVFNTVLFVGSIAFPPAITVLTVVGLVGTAYYFAMAYLELPLALRDATLRDRAVFYLRASPAVLGFGTGVGVFLCVPILNLLFMPAAVAGAVLLHRDLTMSERER